MQTGTVFMNTSSRAKWKSYKYTAIMGDFNEFRQLNDYKKSEHELKGHKNLFHHRL